MLYGVALTSALAVGVTMAAIPAGIACAMSGIAILAFARAAPGAAAAASPWGYALLLGAVFCEACYVVIGKQLTSNLRIGNSNTLLLRP